ncbi:RDD family protein [Agitococcus lubricus]|uniref:Putative RDD family membrane protein YckC n=1 Tax=Agitococcus lubricus TaxID=1077255 RepID=A0A2T5J2C4_9GAMM|nr:RDD family protein [Agitococcus lubricus]PTQ90669.1 putative RDD family membrane protein YckC [Agitococcus lubricus]
MPKKHPSPTQTPTAQTESIPLARAGVRLAAVIYDGLLIVALNAIVAVVLVVIATPSDMSTNNQTVVLPDWFRSLVLFPAMVVMTWLFYGYFWRKNGQTLGMQTWRLKVIKPNGQLLSWGDAAGRCAAAMILPTFCGLAASFLYHSAGAFALSILFGFVGNYLWSWVNGRGLAWHDQLSATVVIRVPVDPRQKRGVLGWFSKTED